MTGQVWLFAGLSVVVTAAWLALYRLPFADPRRRQRIRLAVASRTNLPAKYVFPILGTVIYLALGLLAAAVLARLGDVDVVGVLSWDVSWAGIGRTLLAVVGASALTSFAMSMLYAFAPRVDVPGAVSGVRWVQEILVLPRRWRWSVPMVSAAVEEFVFRGVLLAGLLVAGAPAWLAVVVSGLIFTTAQVLLTEQRLQAFVLAVSSIVLSLVCGLLTIVEASVLPALLVHASFAGYYTNTSAQRATVPAGPPQMRRPG
ncbi:CPBP family intramembrane glutamic endopeptidase [Polymorphospora sp. NPDC050346]|uniref:CPBP family intramembrane glutamic endopeptidase n=1 Tax=Polymorphospora sp. NPDC050346 TaxID=3155780 RepID=UPI0033EF3559